MNLEELLQKEDPAYWEAAFRDFVQNGTVAIDDFLWQWLWNRITWSNGDYSLFYTKEPLLKASLFGVTITITVGYENKRRFVEVSLFESNPYHPDFEEIVAVKKHAARFPSIGNPYLDGPNYTFWEQALFCKLVNIALEERKGLDFLIERSRR
ncbi:MAG: Unknown protein [uncultured Aureispira sp.]|uniref:Uncharacterized protein n=1 Tax=uncultured Aureispira sp. TaxID=1331704 RepID=A0A6S6UM66_9BACT|nr:MAG: Unknown protein [uncultured Aureispira sp.]